MMKSIIQRIIMASYRENNPCSLFSNLVFTIFKNKKIHITKISDYKILAIVIDMFHFFIRIISN
jgi:hypothetical protein